MSSIAFGCVRINRSLLPLTWRWKSAKRGPRKAASSNCSAWIMVPMAPASTRMRLFAAARNAVRFAVVGKVIASGGLLRAGRADAEQMADRENEIGAVHGVKMKGLDAVLVELLHLPGGNRGGNELAGLGVVVEAVELFSEPIWHRGAGAGDKGSSLLEIVHRHDAGHDRNIDAAGADAVEVTEVEVVVEEDLRDRAGGPGIDLGLQRIDVRVEAWTLRMFLRIRRDRHLDVWKTLLD